MIYTLIGQDTAMFFVLGTSAVYFLVIHSLMQTDNNDDLHYKLVNKHFYFSRFKKKVLAPSCMYFFITQ